MATIRRMIAAMARDPRVSSPRWPSDYTPCAPFSPCRSKREYVAHETLEVLAPLAHRLGMATIVREMEDLAFAALWPDKHDDTVCLAADGAPSLDSYLGPVTAQLTKHLEKAHIEAQVDDRTKHYYYSIYQKMIGHGQGFSAIYDLVGIRVHVDDVRDCYAALGEVHTLWLPMQGHFEDYISQPRAGVYQSLHTTVIGPEDEPLEVQIRTYEMHSSVEYGIAALWRQRKTTGVLDNRAVEANMTTWMRPLLHTDTGSRCIGAAVNGRLVALERKLTNG